MITKGIKQRFKEYARRFLLDIYPPYKRRSVLGRAEKLFAVNIDDVEAEKEQKIEDFPILMDFKDAFPEEILGLPPK